MINRNVVLTFISSIGASSVSVITVPIYLHLIGPARYGVIAFVWLIVGYFGLFVLGLDKAITNLMALNRDDAENARSLFNTAMALNLLTSSIGGLIMYFVGYQFLDYTLGVGDEMRGEILSAMPWIAASIPLATTTSLLIGTLEAFGRFSTLASTQFSGTVLSLLLPILVAWAIGPELTYVLPAVILARTAATLWLVILIWPILQLHAPLNLRRIWVPQLVRYGSSISISGIVIPVMVSLDRLLIGASLGAAAVSYYVVPSSLINVMQMLPGSMLRVLFPQLSLLLPQSAKAASFEAFRVLNALMTPLITCLILLIRPIMTLWLGASFAERSQDVAAILLYGAWMNSLAHIPLVLLQAQGRPGMVARIHVGQIVPYAFIVWLGLRFGGVEGAAAACSIRMWADGLLLFQVADLARPAARLILVGASQVTIALIMTLTLPWLSTFYMMLAVVLALTSLMWGALQLPVAYRQRALALLPFR